jgi:hypothetical protein
MQLRDNLSATSFIFEALVARLRKLGNQCPERVVDEVERVANFAYINHPGIFADGRVENVLLDLVDKVANADSKYQEADCFSGHDRPRMLHVVSEVYDTGGHSRVLAKWIDRDLASSHCVVITRQPCEIPELLTATCDQHGVKIVCLSRDSSKIGRAVILRNLAKQADRVILHNHPDDAIPILAFSAPGGPPVAFFNHAHFWFSLGATVADITLNTLPYFKQLTERFRFPRVSALLDGVSGNKCYQPFDKRDSKKALDLDPDIPVLITIGYEHYFQPGFGSDFFATLQKMLKRQRPLQVLIIGPKPEANFIPAEISENPLVRIMGPISDPVPYYQAADVCLESFPHPSLGGFVEAVMYGAAFPISAYAKSENVLRIDLPPLSLVSPRPRDECEYIETILYRLENYGETRNMASKLQDMLWEIDRNWPNIFATAYKKIDSLSHQPGPIPETRCSFEEDHQILADLKPFDLPAEVHRVLPYVEGTMLNIKSVMFGQCSLKETVAYEMKHLICGIRRKI